MSKKIRSARGVVVDFDLLKVKQEMETVPAPGNVKQRQDDINRKLRRRARQPDAPVDVPVDVKVEDPLDVDSDVPVDVKAEAPSDVSVDVDIDVPVDGGPNKKRKIKK